MSENIQAKETVIEHVNNVNDIDKLKKENNMILQILQMINYQLQIVVLSHTSVRPLLFFPFA